MTSRSFSFPGSGAFPWTVAEYRFAGWVPNVSGHLSFGLIDARGKRHTLNQHIDANGGRVVAIHRQRSAQDFPLPGKLVGAFRRSATQDFIIAAQTAPANTPFFDPTGHVDEKREDHGVLVGIVAMLPRDDDKQVAAARKALLQDLDRRIDACLERSAVAQGQVVALPDAILSELVAAQRSIACQVIHFALFRTGEIRLWFDMDGFLGRDTARHPPTALERTLADACPPQAYFFIKDIVHQHYHHDPETDQLLQLIRANGPASLRGIADDEIKWRIDVLRGLAKVVVEFRQSNLPTSNKKALGVLAYADAFQALLARITRGTDLSDKMDENEDVILYDFQNVRLSIEALDALNESTRSAGLQLFAILVGVILSALALWSGAVQIQPILCDAMARSATPCAKLTPSTTTWFVNWIVANPLGFVVILAVLGLAAFIACFKGVTTIPGARRVRRAVKWLSTAISVEVATSPRGGDRLGFVVQLTFIAALIGAAGGLAYWLVPKHALPPSPPPHVQRLVIGPWASLEQHIGKRPRDSNLFAASVITAPLRDVLGPDRDEFFRLMENQTPLMRGHVLWSLGTVPSSPARDGAYILIDPTTQRLEIGLRRNGKPMVYRTPGDAITRPTAVTRFLGSGVADMGALSAEIPVCRSSTGGPTGRVFHMSGNLPGLKYCEYRLTLSPGQVISYSPKVSRGLDLVIIPPGGGVIPMPPVYLPTRAGVHVLHISWARTGAADDVRRPLKPFYVRLDNH